MSRFPKCRSVITDLILRCCVAFVARIHRALLLPDDLFLHGALRIARAALFRPAGPRFASANCEVKKSIPDNLAEAYAFFARALLCLLKHGTIYPRREIHRVVDDARPSCAQSSSTSW